MNAQNVYFSVISALACLHEVGTLTMVHSAPFIILSTKTVVHYVTVVGYIISFYSWSLTETFCFSLYFPTVIWLFPSTGMLPNLLLFLIKSKIITGLFFFGSGNLKKNTLHS